MKRSTTVLLTALTLATSAPRTFAADPAPGTGAEAKAEFLKQVHAGCLQSGAQMLEREPFKSALAGQSVSTASMCACADSAMSSDAKLNPLFADTAKLTTTMNSQEFKQYTLVRLGAVLFRCAGLEFDRAAQAMNPAVPLKAR